ncbi:MAG: hypothetical protein M1531_09670 [Chloroflexi bacterium]|nr:hypothetical protein [Chloroflexota bacterium]
MRSATLPPTDAAAPARWRRPTPWLARIARFLVLCIAAALAVAPIANIVFIISTTGANNPSNDEINFIGKFLGPVLDGTYNWQDFPRDTFVGSHSLLIPGLVYIAIARFADFNMYGILYLGIALTAIRLWLFYDALTQRSSGWLARMLLLPLLAALVFSVSQMSVFEYGNTAMPVGLSQFGFALAVWGLARFPQRWTGTAIMAAGGIMATLSWGSGLAMWPVFFIGMLLLGFRRPAHYAAWLGAAAVSASPYVGPLLLERVPGATTIVSLFNYPFIVGALGWPMSEKVSLVLNPEGQSAALAGVALAVTGLVVLWTRRHTPALRQSAPAVMLMSFSIVTLWQAGVFREYTAPWYSTNAMSFWIGLLGLGYVLWDNHRPGAVPQIPVRKAIVPAVWSVIVIAALVSLYWRSNLNYEDKTFYLPSRSPASAACLRDYRTAPTYCEGTLVGWGMGDTTFLSRLARPLEAHHLSVFAPHQEWTLQGDFGLDNVRIKETPGVPDIVWSADLTNKPVPWSSYKHLNLFLHTPNAIEWTIYLPASLLRADFHSAVAISQSAGSAPSADGVTFQVFLDQKGASTLALSKHIGPDERQWQPISLSLSQYAGQTITLRLTSSPGQNNDWDWAMYRYPYIDLEVDPSIPVDPAAGPGPLTPAPSPRDAVLDVNDPGLWQASGLQPAPQQAGEGRTWMLQHDPSLTYQGTLGLALADYTHFYIRMAASPGISPRLMRVYFRLNGEAGLRNVAIPLYPDGEMHEYWYDLKLLELHQRMELEEVRLARFSPRIPGQALPPLEGERVTIADFRLVRDQNGTVTRTRLPDVVQTVSDMVPGEIWGTQTVGQTFRSNLPNLAAVELSLATYARPVTGSVVFHLRQSPEAESDLRTVEIQAGTVVDNAWRRFEFEPIADSAGKSYYFFLDAPSSVSGKAITMWATSGDAYADGTMMVNHQPASGDLAFRTYHTPE